jgi:UPF0716 protein FxsA
VRRLVVIIALLVIVPIIEIAVLIAVGRVIGVGWTLVLMLATSVLGGWLLRTQGARAWRAFRADVNAGRPPGNAATDGLLVLLGGTFMLVPGFVSDAIGVLLIAPPTRRMARTLVLSVAATRMSASTATSLFGPRRVRARYGATSPSSSSPSSASSPSGGGPATAPDAGEPIEGEIIDPPKPAPPRSRRS